MKPIQKLLFLFLLGSGFLLIAGKTFSQSGADSVTTTLSSSYPAAHNSGTLADFPKLHPLVVHIPIMFLTLAFLTQVFSFFLFRRELSWITLVFVLLGFLGAYLSSGIFHGGDPNLAQLDPVSRATFEMHKQYAAYTVWLSGIAALVKGVSHFLRKGHRLTEILVTLLLALVSYTVVVTGDMGARLVHIDGIGVQGRYIPAHDTM